MRAICCRELSTAITNLLEQNKERFARSVSQIKKNMFLCTDNAQVHKEFMNVYLILRIT